METKRTNTREGAVSLGQPGGFSPSLTKQHAPTKERLSVLHPNEPVLAAVGIASEVREQVAEGDSRVAPVTGSGTGQFLN